MIFLLLKKFKNPAKNELKKIPIIGIFFSLSNSIIFDSFVLNDWEKT